MTGGRINVNKLRESMGLSIEDFAAKLGVHWRTVSRWENAHHDPSPMAIARLRELQHEQTQPARRPYEQGHPYDDQPPSDAATADTRPAVLAAGIVPSRRVTALKG